MSDSSTRDVEGSVTTRLSIMMFLQFFVWGSWYVSMTGWIGAEQLGDDVTSWAYSVAPIAAIISPLFLGMIADRFFATEKVLSALHLLGGLLLIAVPFTPGIAGPSAPKDFTHPFVLALLVHMLCYMPTLGLSNTLAFHHITNPEKQFPLIRVLGTIGWVAGNWVVALLPNGDKSPLQFYVAGGAAVALAVFSLTLPHTPPPSAGKQTSVREVLGLDALSLMKSPSFAVFMICSFLICIPLAGYYAQARNFVEATNTLVFGSATFTMSFGQISEIFFMLIMPLCFARLGVKWMLLVGMFAWVARYGLFAGAASSNIQPMVLGGVILHGICYDFFFVTGQIYVDKRAPAAIRGQAQGFLVLVTQGIGMFIGARVFGDIVAKATDGATKDWQQIWLTPMIAAAVIMFIFAFLFRDDSKTATNDAGVEGGRELSTAH